MNKVHVCLAVALASGTMMTGCTTMGGNIKGSFTCVAPDGICAPSSTIDDRALAMIAGEDGDRMITPAGPYSAPQSAGRGFDTAATAPARSQERVLRIVFPAQIDGAGRLHEQTAVHAVVERGEWQRALASNAVATTPAQVQAATGGDTLLAAVDRADPPFMEDSATADPDMPSAAAVAAARVQADPVGDIKDQVARRLSKAPRRLSVSPSALRTPPAVTYGSKSTSPTPNFPVAVGMTTAAKPLSSPAPVRPAVTSTSALTAPKYVTPAGRTAIAAVGANPAIRAGLARAEPEAREATKTANPLPVLRASSFPGVVQ
ncbi:conjugal transfer protein TraV [Sphingomonas sp. PP-CE-1G-424]|uniref:conjugal transfer protein TraV n=1 Tax=Sphingomonas sp. PP-CE-1G-424 TaxID=2135658 RepID=UPI001055CFE9|nr:conjugal transfer protein TraV [Sphingomonas sp. PP-CE-1G-424]TCP66178.1 conjugal transfer pilus assembly protein TraV [Sphingomonas sp. PP-CE-1G-424]